MSAQETRAKEQAAIAKYLADRKILIVDPGSSSRTGLFSVMQSLGAKTENMSLTNSLSQAEQIVAEKKPQIIITEYTLGKRCGLELLQKLRADDPEEAKKMIFVVVAGNTSQGAVARSAEEDVDAYILKPFTPEVVRKTILRAAVMKVQPSEYYQLIDQGKKKIREASFDEAKKILQEAIKADPAPSLAHFYLGQIDFIQNAMADAQTKYAEGLQFNRIHFKCMVGLFDSLMEQKSHEQAYDIVRRISQYFPANPKRLTEVLKLAVLCSKFEDIEKYYAIFLNIDERDETLIKYICAALVICGKYYLSHGLGHSRALELFTKAAATGYGRTNVLKEIIVALLEQNAVKEAESFLAKFPGESHGSLDYQLCSFLVRQWTESVPFAYDQARALIGKGVVEEQLYALMLRRTQGSKLVDDKELLEEACQKFPKKADKFRELAKKAG